MILYQRLLWISQGCECVNTRKYVTWEESVNYFIINVALNRIMETYLLLTYK